MMAISVISSASATAAPALAGMPSPDGSPAGFADLLFSQLGIAIASAGTPLASNAKGEKATTEKELPTESDVLTADPALAFLMSSPPTQMPQPAKADASPAIIGTSNADANIGSTARTSSTGRSLNEQAGATEPPPLTIANGPDTPAAKAAQSGDTAASNAPRSSFADALAQQTSAAENKTPPLPGIAPPLAKGNTNSKGLASDNAPVALIPTKGTASGQEEKPTSATPPSLLTTRENLLPTGKPQELPGSPANIAAEPAAPTPGPENAPLSIGNTNQASKAETVAQTKSEIAAPLHSNAWARDFSDKVVWLAKSDQQQAQININPPQLGPIQITLNISGDQASAVFTSAHPEVRQAIENSLPQLKEMLSGAGINLGQADVGANLPQQNREAPSQPMNGNRLANENAILPGDGNAGENKISTPLQRGRGLVDLFA